jgi:hypothetical protein
VQEMENLIAEQEERNKKGLHLELADDIESDVEKEGDFLVKEYHFLLSINNMQAKIHEAKYYIDELTTGTLRKLRKFFQKEFPQSNYQMESLDIEQTLFKKEYDQRMKHYKTITKQLEYCS